MSGFPIRMDRDPQLVNFQAYLPAWPTVAQVQESTSYSVLSDGLVPENFATMDIFQVATVPDNQCLCVGVHLEGPQDGEEYTPYMISVSALSGDPMVRPFLFVGESPATINSAAAGNVVTDIRIIGTHSTAGQIGITAFNETGGSLDKDICIAVKRKTADRKICFGVGMVAGLSTLSGRKSQARLSVRRLYKTDEPRIINTRKLG